MRGVPSGLRHALAERQNPLLPWTAAGDFAMGDFSRIRGLAVLAAWTVAAVVFGWTQFRRSLRLDAGAARSALPHGGAAAGRPPLLYSLPGLLLKDPLAALVQNEFRSWSARRASACCS